jgi:hypothetical protein
MASAATDGSRAAAAAPARAGADRLGPPHPREGRRDPLVAAHAEGGRSPQVVSRITRG